MLKKLLARLAQIKADAENILNVADAESDGIMTEEQESEFNALMAETKTLQSQIDTRQKFLDTKADDERGQGRQSAYELPGANVEIKPVAEDPTKGFADIGEFALSVAGAFMPGARTADERLNVLGAPTNFHKEGGANEGYEVPPQFRNAIFDLAFDNDDLLSMVDSEPTSSNAVEMNTDETTPWGASGVQAAWAAEGSQFSATELISNQETVKLHKLYAFCLATEEILEDAPRLANRLTTKAGQAINWKANDAIINGTGAGQPLGYFNSSALISVAKEGSQAADTIQTENVAKMFSRMDPNSLGRAVWIANSNILPELLTMTIANQPVYTAPGVGMQQAPGGTLLGRPVIFTGHAKTLGDKGDIQFIDPMGYYMARKEGGIKFASSIHLYFDYDMQAFRWTFRLGGQPFLSAPVTPDNGSTYSHFVTLDERA